MLIIVAVDPKDYPSTKVSLCNVFNWVRLFYIRYKLKMQKKKIPATGFQFMGSKSHEYFVLFQQ